MSYGHIGADLVTLAAHAADPGLHAQRAWRGLLPPERLDRPRHRRRRGRRLPGLRELRAPLRLNGGSRPLVLSPAGAGSGSINLNTRNASSGGRLANEPQRSSFHLIRHPAAGCVQSFCDFFSPGLKMVSGVRFRDPDPQAPGRWISMWAGKWLGITASRRPVHAPGLWGGRAGRHRAARRTWTGA
jgi:hypothetical protein